MVKVICHNAHRRLRRMVQCYSTGDSNVSSHEGAYWRHLANTIKLVHPSAHSSPQSKRQMDRFSRFCTAYGRKCLYFTMGAPIHQNCPFPWGSGVWTSHGGYVMLSAHASPQPERHLDRFSRLCTDDHGATASSPSNYTLKIILK